MEFVGVCCGVISVILSVGFRDTINVSHARVGINAYQVKLEVERYLERLYTLTTTWLCL